MALTIVAIVLLGIVLVLDALMFFAADSKGEAGAVGVILIHVIPLIVAVVALAVSL